MYILIDFSYDYYEIAEVICVSKSVSTLVDKYEEMKGSLEVETYLCKTEECHNEYSLRDMYHMAILPIKEI